MRRVLRVIAPVVALGLSACGPAAQSLKSVPPSHAASSVASPKAEPDSSPTATPASVPSINDAVSLAAELAGVEQAIRIPDTAAEEYLVLGQRQRPVAVPRRDQPDRDQHGPHPGSQLGWRPGTDAVHAGDLGKLWPRRRQQSARRHPRRGSLPARAWSPAKYDSRHLCVQP